MCESVACPSFACNCSRHTPNKSNRSRDGCHRLHSTVHYPAVKQPTVQRAYCSLSIDIKNENCNANISADDEQCMVQKGEVEHEKRWPMSSSRWRCHPVWIQGASFCLLVLACCFSCSPGQNKQDGSQQGPPDGHTPLRSHR